MDVPTKHQIAIAKDTIRNPMKGRILGGPTLEECYRICEKHGVPPPISRKDNESELLRELEE